MMPNGWKIKTLTELTNEKLSYGANAPSCKYRENALRYIRITDINDFGNLNEDCVGIEESVGINYSLKHHDFLFARSGNTVGKTFLFDENIHPKSAYAGYLIRYRPNQKLLLAEYLKQYCFSEYYHKWVQSQLRAGAQPNINAKEYGSMEIPLPPLPEQQKIATILTTWDKAIDTTERLIDNSKQQKKALMQQLLTGKKRLLDEDGKRFEGEWEEVKLGDLFEFSTSSSKSKFIDQTGTNYILDMGSVTRDGKLKPTKKTLINKDFLSKGQLIMPKDDIGGGQIIGRVGYVDKDFKYILSDHVYCLTSRSGCSLFLSYLINSFPVNKQLRRHANGTAQLGLGKKDVERQLIKIPSTLKEQQKIAAVLTNADKEIDLLEQQLADLQQEKKALMQVLLTGKVRVGVA